MIAYDPWNATHIALRLQDEGATMVEFRQGFRSTAAPTSVLDPAGNLKPAKDKSTERIDGIVALIMAIGRALVEEEEPYVEYSMFFV
jgi:phage terminase large subunit-like protein